MASSGTAIRRPMTPRTGSAKWGRPVSRPATVKHPAMSRSVDLDLTITGTPTPGLCSDRGDLAPSRIVQWPPEHLKPAGKSKSRLPKSTAWRTDNDLFEEVKSKLITGFEGVKQMFKAKDPYGDSIVTREGLFIILKALVGHISREQFDSFLKSICLHWRSSISFNEFIVRFHDNPALASCSVNGLPHRQQQQQQHQPHLEDNLRSIDMLEWCPFTSAPHAFVMFRKKLQKGEINVRDILPASCFLKDGRIIGPQLREALALCDLRLTDQEFEHIWLKFDPDYNGTVSTKAFYKCLGLAPNGFSRSDPRATKSAHATRRSVTVKGKETVEKRCKTEMSTTRLRTSHGTVSVSKVDTVEICGDKAEVMNNHVRVKVRSSAGSGASQAATRTEEKREEEEVEEETRTTTTTSRTKKKKTTTTTTETTVDNDDTPLISDEKLAGHVRMLIQAKKAQPSFSSVMDHLSYKFEETYRNLQSAFKLFDFMGDGYVARIDFRRVLKEFGYDIAAVDLDAFLASAGISCVQGLINYKQFLHKYQSRGDSSVFNTCMNRNNQSKRIETQEILRAKGTESDVSNFFHADYKRLLNLLQQKDKRNTGTVGAQDLRSAVNAVLKINMTDAEFGELLARLTVSADSNNNNTCGPAVNYSTFLELLNSDPGKWNYRQDGHWTVPKYQLRDIPPSSPVLRLQEKAKTWMAPSKERQAVSNKRVTEIKRDLTKLFTDRFHIFDKSFKDMDRRKSGYMTKWQLGALIKLCGLTLSVADLNYLWATLDTAADNTICYATLVKTFTSTHQQKLQQQLSNKRPSTAKSREVQRQHEALEVNGVSNGDNSALVVPSNEKTVVEQPHVTPGSTKEGKLVELIKRVRDTVLECWEELYTMFLSYDRDGHASIAVDDMKSIMYKAKLPLTGPQRDELCNMFDLRSNGWFHYVSFLHAIKKHTPGEHLNPYVFDIRTKRLHRKAGPTSTALTLYDFLVELKTMLLKKHKTLRISFKTFDLNRSGYIEEAELRKGFTQLGFPLSDQDFLDILQVLDRSHGQRVSFDDFKSVLLTL